MSFSRIFCKCLGSFLGCFAISIAHAQSPIISYLIPDIGAPGMSSYVEIIAPYNRAGTFGSDSLYSNDPESSVQVVCADPDDTSKVTIGPLIVSWQGREISTQIFVSPCLTPNSTNWQSLDRSFAIPLEVLVNNVPSNTDTFFIVNPNPALNVSGGGVLGSGGIWGIRSKRGALLFDSISLGPGTYTISTDDCDLSTLGNQGYLPAVIIINGDLTLSSGAILSGSANGKDGGPGGGGGSMGDGPVIDSGGNGFVGGSSGESGGGAPCSATGGTGTGGYGDVNGGGIGMNQIIPEPSDALPNCQYFGGTGDPFVSEAGGVVTHTTHAGDGNGGGFGTAGENGRGENGFTPDLGGIINGNPMLVPLMGGSGGGGGNEFCDCDENTLTVGAMAGGGGGALCIYASQIDGSNGSIQVNGANGVSGGFGCVNHGSVGGCGSGGGLIIESKQNSLYPSVSAAGGVSLHTHVWAGNGGAGRIRFDGPMMNNPTILSDSSTMYRGISIDSGWISNDTILMLSGTGNETNINFYVKQGSFGLWMFAGVCQAIGSDKWVNFPIKIDPNEINYVVAVKNVPNPSSISATMEPSWVMSQAGTYILGSCCNGNETLLSLSKNEISVFDNSCNDFVETTIPLGIAGCISSPTILDSLWITGSESFQISDTRTNPRTLASSDSILVSYDGSGGTDTAALHLQYDLGSGIRDTTVQLIGSTSPLVAHPLQLHRESASAYYGQIDSLPLGVDVGSQVNLDSLWPYLTEISASYTWDSTVATSYDYVPPVGWGLMSLSSQSNSVSFVIQNRGSSASDPLNLGTALFQPRTAQFATSWVTMPSVTMDIGNENTTLCVTDNEDNHWVVKTLGVLSGVAEELEPSQDIAIYPNPVNSEIFVRNPNETTVAITVYDAIGRKILTLDADENSTSSINMGAFSNGPYFFVYRVDGHSETRCVVKQ